MSDTEREDDNHRYIREELKRLREAVKTKGLAPGEWVCGLLAEAIELAGAMDELEWLDATYRLMFGGVTKLRQQLNARKSLS